MLNDGLDGRETSARGQQHHGLGAVFTQVEAAKRPLNAQNIFFFHDAKNVICELAAWHVAYVQFGAGVFELQVRCGSHGVGAPVAVAQQEFNILASVVLEHITGWQLQAHQHHIVRGLGQAAHANRHFLDWESTFVGDLPRFEHHIRMRHGAAGQDETLFGFFRRQSLELVRALRDGAFEFFALARAAGTVLAAVGQANALANGGG